MSALSSLSNERWLVPFKMNKNDFLEYKGEIDNFIHRLIFLLSRPLLIYYCLQILSFVHDSFGTLAHFVWLWLSHSINHNFGVLEEKRKETSKRNGKTE